MSMSSIPSPSPTGKLYGWVEKIGNKVPHPFLLFIYLIVALMVATAILSARWRQLPAVAYTPSALWRFLNSQMTT